MQQVDGTAHWVAVEPAARPLRRLWSAGRTTGQLLLAFVASFVITAGVLLLAHV